MEKLIEDNLLSEILMWFDWLKEKTFLIPIPLAMPGWVEIQMPFLDKHNDHFQIYVLKENDNYLIGDDGFILTDLKMSGYELNDSNMNKIVLILKGFGISLKNRKLTTEAQLENFPFKMTQMIQAMTVINNL